MNIKSLRVVDHHAEMLAGYVEVFPQAKLHGFEREMRAWCKRHKKTLNINLDGGWALEPIGFRPDGYIIDDEAECIVLVEAENTSFVTKRKWQAIADFAWLVDGAEWSSIIHIVDRSRVIRCIDLLEVAIAHLAGHAPKSDAYLRRLYSRQAGHVLWTPDDGFLKEPVRHSVDAECVRLESPDEVAR